MTLKPLILLHGAIGAASQLNMLKDALSTDYEVHILNFSGHGDEMMPDEPFSIPLFANNVLRYMERKGIAKASIFGYSMGGYVGLYLARHYPQKVEKVVTMASKFNWDEATAAKEIQMLQPEKIEQKIPAFAQTLKERHHPNDWKNVLAKTAAMMTALGAANTLKADDYTAIHLPVLVMLGDRDRMVGLDETLAVYKSLPDAQMAMLPDTQHPIEQVDVQMLAFMLRKFI